jgi:hypothetical protein
MHPALDRRPRGVPRHSRRSRAPHARPIRAGGLARHRRGALTGPRHARMFALSGREPG